MVMTKDHMMRLNELDLTAAELWPDDTIDIPTRDNKGVLSVDMTQRPLRFEYWSRSMLRRYMEEDGGVAFTEMRFSPEETAALTAFLEAMLL